MALKTQMAKISLPSFGTKTVKVRSRDFLRLICAWCNSLYLKYIRHDSISVGVPGDIRGGPASWGSLPRPPSPRPIPSPLPCAPDRFFIFIPCASVPRDLLRAPHRSPLLPDCSSQSALRISGGPARIRSWPISLLLLFFRVQFRPPRSRAPSLRIAPANPIPPISRAPPPGAARCTRSDPNF